MFSSNDIINAKFTPAAPGVDTRIRMRECYKSWQCKGKSVYIIIIQNNYKCNIVYLVAIGDISPPDISPEQWWMYEINDSIYPGDSILLVQHCMSLICHNQVHERQYSIRQAAVPLQCPSKSEARLSVRSQSDIAQLAEYIIVIEIKIQLRLIKMSVGTMSRGLLCGEQ